MNLKSTNSVLKIGKISGKSILFLLLAGSAPIALAQSINDDLSPQKTVKKSSNPKSNKAGKSKTKPVVRKTASSTPVTMQTVAATVPTQTPAQILERFMNFQQSGSLTFRDWDSLVVQTNAALQANPNDATTKAQLFIGQGQVAYNRNDFSTALVHFNGAAQILPDSALPVYCIGKVYLVTKQPVEAQKAFEKAVKLNKNFALAYKGWGDALTAQGKSKNAQEYYKQAAKIGLNGGQGSSNTQASSASSTTANNTGGNNQTNSTQPNTAPQTPALSPYEADLKSARELTAKKKWQNSLNKLLPLSKSTPTPEVYLAIGDNYFGLRQWMSAQQAYRKAAEINPNSALAFYKVGTAMTQMNEFQSASEAFEKSLILDQTGAAINRANARKLADETSQKAKDVREGKKGKKLFIF